MNLQRLAEVTQYLIINTDESTKDPWLTDEVYHRAMPMKIQTGYLCTKPERTLIS